MIRLVTLDINNTILRFRHSPAQEYARAAARFALPVDAARLPAALKQSLAEQRRISPVYGRDIGHTWQHWWKTTVKNTFAAAGVGAEHGCKVSAAADHLLAYFGTAQAYEKLPHAQDLLHFLSANDRVVVGAISNTDPRIAGVLEGHNLLGHFTFVLDSYTAGVCKPNPEIFRQAVELSNLSNLSNSEILHIGDSVRKDYLCAREAGYEALLVAPDFEKDCLSCGVETDPRYMFHDLPQMISALDKII